MQIIKDIYTFLDYFFITIWGFTLIDIIPIITGGTILTTFDNFIKSMFALAGFIFILIRMHHYWHDKKLDRKIKKES